MADQKSLFPLIPESVDEAAKNLSGPVTKSAGDTLADIWFLVFGSIHGMAEKKKMKIAADLDAYKKELESKVEAIPDEHRQDPKLQVVGPALEKSKYCVEEKDIRDLFSNLITHSMDDRFNTKVHPSFTEIIAQMSPLDAQNLALFSHENRIPIAEYKFHVKSGGDNTILTNVFLANEKMNDAILLQSSSLSSLSRLGLVSVTYSYHLLREHISDPFEQHQYFVYLKEHTPEYQKTRSDILDFFIQKGTAMLTPLGEDFLAVCYDNS